MSSQTSGPLTRAAAAGCAKTWSLTVMTALAVTPAARCDPDARMRGEEDSRCFQISRIALETVSRFRRKRKDEESKQLAGLNEAAIAAGPARWRDVQIGLEIVVARHGAACRPSLASAPIAGGSAYTRPRRACRSPRRCARTNKP